MEKVYDPESISLVEKLLVVVVIAIGFITPRPTCLAKNRSTDISAIQQ